MEIAQNLKNSELEYSGKPVYYGIPYQTKSDIEKIDKKVKNIITKCEEFSESSPFPDKSIMYDVVYEQKDYPFIKHKID